MSLSIAVVRERLPGESRVALVPETAKKFTALGAKLCMEQSARSTSTFQGLPTKSKERCKSLIRLWFFTFLDPVTSSEIH